MPEIPELLDDDLPLKEQLVALRRTLDRVKTEIDKLSTLKEELGEPAMPQKCLFETAPTVSESLPCLPVSQKVIESANPEPDVVLEKATLDELNLALGLAFAQIASKRTW